jgi:hypothetical protein
MTIFGWNLEQWAFVLAWHKEKHETTRDCIKAKKDWQRSMGYEPATKTPLVGVEKEANFEEAYNLFNQAQL